MKRENKKIKKANPVQLSNVLETVVKDLEIGQDIYLETLKKNWIKIVGTLNARKTHPITLRNGILTIAVSSPVWITQARFYKSTFIDKIREFKPQYNVEIYNIRFKLDAY